MDEPEIVPPEIPPVKPIPSSRNPILLLISVILFSVGICIASLLSSRSPVSSRPAAESKNIHQAVWLTAPEELDDLGLFQNTQDMIVNYYLVGNDQSKRLIMANVPPNWPGGNSTFMLLEDQPNHYLLLSKYSSINGDEQLNTNVTPDSQINYPDLDFDYTLNIKGMKLSVYNSIPYLENPPKVRIKPLPNNLLEQTPWGPLYLSGMTIRLDLPNFTYVNFQPGYDFVSDNQTPDITWNDGTKNTDSFEINHRGGCGSTTYTHVLAESEIKDLQPAGKTSTGEIIYDFKNLNNQTFNRYLNLIYTPEGETPITPAEYRTAHGLVVYHDRLDRYVVMANNKYVPAAECGKPVIYLYPPQPSQVSVRLNVRVKNSQPEYGTGWQVLAYPDGRIISGGKTYPYLYWDGIGQIYPEINFGFIVPRAELEITLQKQLAQQGLNPAEIADFMDYWLPLMPKTPYTRLTWLTLDQIDNLAPLYVNPKPDTVIRVFLDFAGLEQPVPLSPQKLSAPARSGFTLVEWGGLIIKK